MTAEKRPNSRRNLDIAINRLFDDDDEALRVRRLMANVIVGQLLPGGAVKGGSALKLRYGQSSTRFSMDLDTARATDLADYVARLEAALAVGWEGFTGRLVPREPAKPKGIPVGYVMQPYDAKLLYNGKSWLTVPVEIGYNEIGDADEADMVLSAEMAELFEKLGFPAPGPVPLMKLEYQVAQKLHAVSEPGSERAHDLIDLQVIVANSDLDLGAVRSVCVRLFDYRRKQPWPPHIVVGEGWEQLYAGQLADTGVLETADEAAMWANRFVASVDAARLV
ncbi:MAG: nucleotidyl transferase AbiEii/AbiGii toxin family protein [Coriobacteriia bacterium]|nr:nucleotidyl transferase AbiEii/AbiGii toxin family protein [Coriobacteriia bacterium]